MKWLRQQNKVELLSAASQQQARQMTYHRNQLVQRVNDRLRQPGTLAWAFAAGTLFGTTQHPQQNKSAVDILRYVNGASLLWGLLAKHQFGISPTPGIDQG